MTGCAYGRLRSETPSPSWRRRSLGSVPLICAGLLWRQATDNRLEFQEYSSALKQAWKAWPQPILYVFGAALALLALLCLRPKTTTQYFSRALPGNRNRTGDSRYLLSDPMRLTAILWSNVPCRSEALDDRCRLVLLRLRSSHLACRHIALRACFYRSARTKFRRSKPRVVDPLWGMDSDVRLGGLDPCPFSHIRATLDL